MYGFSLNFCQLRCSEGGIDADQKKIFYRRKSHRRYSAFIHIGERKKRLFLDSL